MPNCIFCKIAKGEIPANKLYEDDKVVAFFDMAPKAPGHVLLIPKPHYEWFYEMPDDVSDDVFRTAKRLALELKNTYKADFVRLNIVGTDIPHVHLHLIPQRLNPGQGPLH
jgi:histidine triad (HIT) family protein